jgi:hypothetical protein
MANLILNGSTSGSITISSPAVSGTTTLTLPTTSGTVLTNGTNTNFPVGSVLQVVAMNTTTTTSTSGATLINTSVTASITPSSTANRILVKGSICGARAGSGPGVRFYLFDGTSSYPIENYLGYPITNVYCATSFTFIFSPATTSSITYTVRIASPFGGTVYINGDNENSGIVLMEIKG